MPELDNGNDAGGEGAAALDLVSQVADAIGDREHRAHQAQARARFLAETAVRRVQLAEEQIQAIEHSKRRAVDQANALLRDAARALEQANERIAAAEARAQDAQERAEAAEERAAEAERALARIEDAIRKRIIEQRLPVAANLATAA